MNQVVSRGIILSRTNFGEADRIITVLTPNHGKVRLMAKGVRRIKSKLAGGIELFSVSDVTFILGRGDIGTLISSRLDKHFGRIAQDIDRTMYGYEMLKTINRVTEDMPGEEYFDLLKQALGALDEFSLPLESLRLWFDLQLIKLAGHSPNLKSDNHGNPLNPDKTYGFNIDDMVFTAPNGRYGAAHIKLLRLVLSLDSAIKLRQIKDIDSIQGDCLDLVRTMLLQFIRT